MSHFDLTKYLKHTAICIGARVAISTVNFLPEVGLYNRTIENVVQIVYQDRQVGPNDKQHYHLPDYVVVDIPHLKLPASIEPWDKLHTSVSILFIHNVYKMFNKTHTKQKHIPIPMRTQYCRKSCCLVTFCPLVPAWATTLHKF
jgi:hypothetical protein